MLLKRQRRNTVLLKDDSVNAYIDVDNQPLHVRVGIEYSRQGGTATTSLLFDFLIYKGHREWIKHIVYD